MGNVWEIYMYGKFMGNPWNRYGKFLGHLWNIYKMLGEIWKSMEDSRGNSVKYSRNSKSLVNGGRSKNLSSVLFVVCIDFSSKIIGSKRAKGSPTS